MTAPWPRRPLFNPGPVSLSPAVRETASWPEIGHRDPDFQVLFGAIRERVLAVYEPLLGSTHEPAVFAGSGATAVDAIVLDAAREGGATAVLVGGPYGERMFQTLSAVGYPAYRIGHRPGEPLVDAVRAGLEPGTHRLAMVHHDTSTATLGDLAGAGALCEQEGLGLVVDAVSSFACEDLAAPAGVRTWWATCSNKALEAPPGLAICLRPRDVPEAAAAVRAPITLDLGRHVAHQSGQDLAFTVPTQVAAGLSVALDELAAEGGWPKRNLRYRNRSEALRERLAGLGLWPVIEDVEQASALTLARLPAGYSFAALSAHLARSGLRAYAAQGEYAGSCFRISTMGAITHDDLDRLAAALEEIVR
ncbi:pyridoxal-phosphate-dependent aminotransferase family protein [Amycolatopsis sp. NPDC005003]